MERRVRTIRLSDQDAPPPPPPPMELGLEPEEVAYPVGRGTRLQLFFWEAGKETENEGSGQKARDRCVKVGGSCRARESR